MTPTLYRDLLGSQFDMLPEKLQEMHGGASLAKGRADIERGKSPLARLICALSHVPKTGRATSSWHFDFEMGKSD